jgi:hypothetical protein
MYCPDCPKDIRDMVVLLQRNESDTAGNMSISMYGSRKIFFDRIWSRIHKDSEQTETGAATDDEAEAEDEEESHSLKRKREEEEEKYDEAVATDSCINKFEAADEDTHAGDAQQIIPQCSPESLVA